MTKKGKIAPLAFNLILQRFILKDKEKKKEKSLLIKDRKYYIYI
jgi:hypothetical protein